MSRTCRLCSEGPGHYRTVSVGHGLTRRWAICDPCIDTLRDARWVEVDGADHPEQVALRVGLDALVDATDRDER